MRLHGYLGRRHHGAEGRCDTMRARWAVPFCHGSGHQVGLWYLAAGWRHTTRLPRSNKLFSKHRCKQKQRLVELIAAGPLVVGCETACWTSVLIRVLIWRELGILYNRHYPYSDT